MTRVLFRSLAVAMMCGALIGTLLLYIALGHGTQSEFYVDSGAFDYAYAVQIFLSWFVLGTAAAWAVYGAFRALASPFRRRWRTHSQPPGDREAGRDR